MPPPPTRSRSVAWKPLVVCPQPAFYRRMQAVLAQLAAESQTTTSVNRAGERMPRVLTALAVEQPCALTEYPRSATIATLVEHNGCNICFLDAATDSEHAHLLISELAPSIPVVVLHPRNDADLILRCLRRGACEFIADPTVDAVLGVFERLARTRSGAAHPPPGAGDRSEEHTA